jgi:hypothetical protein
MGDSLTWNAISEQWPWFAAAAGVLIVVIGLLVLLRPRSKRQLVTSNSVADNKGWILTGRIDFVEPHSNGELVLQVEETQIVNSPGGVEHREIRWRMATLAEAKTVLVSYHAQRKLLMSANFIVSAPIEPGRSVNGQGDKQDVELRDGANGQGLANVKPVAAEATNEAS